MSGRGLSQKSKDLIEGAYRILEEVQPCSVRAVCYRLFAAGLIPSMKQAETQKVSRLLVYARENEIIPWEWITDETREAEIISAWSSLEDYGKAVLRSYRKDFWGHQPVRVEVWSEKGTIRGALAPVLDEYAVTFRVHHGFSSATIINKIADETGHLEDNPLVALYVGDWDPSGLYMSDEDLPSRLFAYGANVDILRVALTSDDVSRGDLPHFSADTKSKDPRHAWFRKNYGSSCWELDAMSPSVLRERVRSEIRARLDIDAWNHCVKIEFAERESLRGLFCYRSQNTSEDRQ